MTSGIMDEVFRVTWHEQSDFPPLVCGSCGEEIILKTKDEGVIDAYCGCEEPPSGYNFLSYDVDTEKPKHFEREYVGRDDRVGNADNRSDGG